MKSMVLQVKGNSMDKYDIFANDYVIVKNCKQAKPGDIVITQLDNKLLSLKSYVSGMKVQGKVEGVIRRYGY